MTYSTGFSWSPAASSPEPSPPFSPPAPPPLPTPPAPPAPASPPSPSAPAVPPAAVAGAGGVPRAAVAAGPELLGLLGRLVRRGLARSRAPVAELPLAVAG